MQCYQLKKKTGCHDLVNKGSSHSGTSSRRVITTKPSRASQIAANGQPQPKRCKPPLQLETTGLDGNRKKEKKKKWNPA